MKSIGVIGSVGSNDIDIGGQIVKTKELIKYLKQEFEEAVELINVELLRKMPYLIVPLINKTLRNNDIVIVILASRGYSCVLPILTLLNNIYKRRVIEFVIGGLEHEILKKRIDLRYCAGKNERIYVESPYMAEEYRKIGLNNCEYLPNFKTLDIVKEINFNRFRDKYIEVCTFCRVTPVKGIEDAINIVIKTNQALGQSIYRLTIYGTIDSAYQTKFEEIEKNFPEYIKYGGCIPYELSSTILKNYAILLFPTLHKQEGFPGTVIDAYAAGLPVIAYISGRISDILVNKREGFLLPAGDIDGAVEKMVTLYHNRDILENMSKNCIKEAEKYMTPIVLKRLKEQLLSVK